jgi:hypothetical protein
MVRVAYYFERSAPSEVLHTFTYVKNCCVLYINCRRRRWVTLMLRIRRTQVQTPARRLTILIEVFVHRSGHVEFVVDEVALGQVFSEYFGFPCQFAFHRLLHNHHHHHHLGLVQ